MVVEDGGGWCKREGRAGRAAGEEGSNTLTQGGTVTVTEN